MDIVHAWTPCKRQADDWKDLQNMMKSVLRLVNLLEDEIVSLPTTTTTKKKKKINCKDGGMDLLRISKLEV